MTSVEKLHKAMMLEAVREARHGRDAGHGGPFGAVVTREGRIVAKAHNTAILTGDPTDHAEMLAMRDACLKLGAATLEGCVIYATGQPCLMCLGAAVTLAVPVIYYANSFADSARLGSSGPRAGAIIRKVLGCEEGAFTGDFVSAPGLTVVRLPLPEALALYA